MKNKIKIFYARNRNKFILATSGIISLILLVNFYFILVLLPTSNDECLWVAKKDEKGIERFYFDKVKFEGVTWNAGIRDGDILISINGEVVDSPMNGMNIINKLSKGEKAKYEIERNGERLIKYVEIKKLINYQGLAVTVLSFIWLIVATMVLLANNKGKSQKLFYQIGVFFSFASLYYMLWGTPSQNPTYFYPFLRVGLDLIYTFAASFLPFLWLRFFLIFPFEHKWSYKSFTKRFLTLTPIIIFIYTVIFRIFLVYNRGIAVPEVYLNFIVSPLYVINIWGLISGLFLLFSNYKKLSTKKEKDSIFVILLGYTIGVATIIYLVLFTANTTLDVQFNNPIYFTPIIMIVLIPISFGFSIFKYSLMDMTDVFKNTILYGIASVSLAVTYFLFIYIIGFTVSSAIGTKYQGVIAGIVFIIFALIFQSSKDKLQELITQKLYPEQFAFQKVLIKFSSLIYTIVGLKSILEFTNRIFKESLKINKFAILLQNAEFNKYTYNIGYGIKEDNLEITFDNEKLNKNLLLKDKIGSEAVIDSQEFKEIFGGAATKLEDEGIFTVVPLRMQNKILGFLLFGLKYSGSKFNQKDLELIVVAANQIAISIENARLYEVESENIKYQQEIENAKKIQESLLPKYIPEVKGLEFTGIMIPAMHIGGDYYDVIKVSETKVFAVVGDVAGKGLSASFYMSKLQTMIKLFVKESLSPKEILIKINENISKEIDKHSFITVILALFDTENKTVTISRAGHPPLIRIKENEHYLYQPKGIGLGLEKGELFKKGIEEEVIKYDRDETFILFSDGVTEAMNEKNELFGINNLIKTVKMHSSERAINIKNAILTSIKFFTEKVEANDDIAIIVIKTLDN